MKNKFDLPEPGGSLYFTGVQIPVPAWVIKLKGKAKDAAIKAGTPCGWRFSHEEDGYLVFQVHHVEGMHISDEDYYT